MARRYVRDSKGRFSETGSSSSGSGSDIPLGNSPYRGRIASINQIRIGSVTSYEASWGKQYLGRHPSRKLASNAIKKQAGG